MWSIIGQVAALITYATLGIDFRRRLRGEIFDVQSFVGCFCCCCWFWLVAGGKIKKEERDGNREREGGEGVKACVKNSEAWCNTSKSGQAKHAKSD